jgi:hypothetical protein
MLSIDYDIQIGGLNFRPGTNSRLIGLHSCASMNAPVHYCRMSFSVPADLSIAEGDAVTVQLGYKDEGLSTVFTGVAAQVEWRSERVTVEAESQFRQLTALRTNSYFENAFAGDIARALSGETDVSNGRVEPGLRFAFYAIGSNRSAQDQIRELAAQCGFDFYADVDDKMVFGMPLPGGAPEMFGFGTNILELKVEQAQQNNEGVEVFGESPASFGAGPDAAAWFTKSEVKGSAGGGKKIRVYAPSAREQQTAVNMANNLWNKWSPRKKGNLRTLGKAKLALGGMILVSGMPADAQNGTYKITGVAHRLGGNAGFITQLDFEEM